MSAAPVTDEELIARSRAEGASARAGDSVDELFQRYHKRVAIWCLRWTGDRESAADVAQEVFLKAHQHLGAFRGDSKFSTWLYSIARNQCFNYVKARSRRPVEVGVEFLPENPDDVEEHFFEAIEEENWEQEARELLNTVLEEVERRVLILHYADEVPLRTVTRLLALDNPSGAKAYIVSAKRKLRRALERSKAARGRH